ncbi:uracil-xanthine permease [Archangium gephyra]|nr:uracil-xanthine permease [Archangium gephyra]
MPLPLQKKVVLGLQHTIAMFGATVLVPLLTGLNPSVALFGAGLATLLFHVLTGLGVPIFLGSSFAFIAPIISVLKAEGPAAVGGGLVAAGAMYLVFSALVKAVGIRLVQQVFPPIVTGPVIIVIGLSLAGVAVNQAQSHWLLALVTLMAAIVTSVFARGLFKMIPILIAVITGYLVALVLGAVEPAKLGAIRDAAWVGLPPFHGPAFSWSAIFVLAPVAIVTFIEHIGDVIVNGRVVGKNFLERPGLPRTLFADGLANMASAVLGGPAATTYAENTGVLAVTRVYDPAVLRIAAGFAMLFGLSPKLAAVFQSLPAGVLGGVSILLFGMIASVGIRTLSEARIDFAHSRNLIVVSLILVLGLGGAKIPVAFGDVRLELHGMALAALVGILANALLPASLDREELDAHPAGEPPSGS